MSKIREKESLEYVRMHIWASKTQKLPGPLSGPWTPAAECSLHSRDSASLRRQLSASEAGPPLDPILDPHLTPNINLRVYCQIETKRAAQIVESKGVNTPSVSGSVKIQAMQSLWWRSSDAWELGGGSGGPIFKRHHRLALHESWRYRWRSVWVYP